MTTVSTQPRRRLRWWIGVVLVLAAQAGLILLLNKESSAKPANPAPRSVFRVLTNTTAVDIAVVDPTLFALPHNRDAWRAIPQPEIPRMEWRDHSTTNWVTLNASNLGTGLAALAQNEETPSFPIIALAEPRPVFPPVPSTTPLSTPSKFWIEGDLATRKLIPAFLPADLGAFTNGDLLSKTVVQVAVDAHGSTLSAVLFRRSGSAEADSNALWIARNARFAPVASAGSANGGDAAAGLTLGNFIFQWQTLPPASTNTNTALK